jgi:hypothetical protein
LLDEELFLLLFDVSEEKKPEEGVEVVDFGAIDDDVDVDVLDVFVVTDAPEPELAPETENELEPLDALYETLKLLCEMESICAELSDNDDEEPVSLSVPIRDHAALFDASVLMP